MKQHNSNNRRSRSRGNKQRHGSGRNNFDSNGPGGKVRGSAQQVLDKYLGLARDAQSSGDRISAESFFQFAEHYFRVLNVEVNNGQGRRDRGPLVSEDDAVSVIEENILQTDSEKVGDSAHQNTDTNEGSVLNLEDQLQPDIGSNLANIIPPAIEVVPKDSSEEESPPKTRRRRRNPVSSSESIDVSKVP
jgi:hypothetical protein